MSTRTTNAELNALVSYLNTLTGQPSTPYSKDADGKYVANVGNYHIDGAYGGVNLHQIVNTGGGIKTVFTMGYMPKSELAGRIRSFIAGIETGKSIR